jgi:DNA-binding NtrC family response regulator
MNTRTQTGEETSRAGHALYGGLPGTQTILLVEDERFVREVTGEVLRSAGYNVLTARNAAEAMREYEACCSPVELLLTDVILPGESGHALAARLRRVKPELKVLLVSGYGEQMGPRKAGNGECLAKPYSTGVLLGRVREVIDGGESGGGAREQRGEEQS